MSQKIIIPKGLINPNETTIIEIPEAAQSIETVIAKPIGEVDYTNMFGGNSSSKSGQNLLSTEDIADDKRCSSARINYLKSVVNENMDVSKKVKKCAQNVEAVDNDSVDDKIYNSARNDYLKSVFNRKMNVYRNTQEGNYVDLYEDISFNNFAQPKYRKTHRKIFAGDYEFNPEDEYCLEPVYTPPHSIKPTNKLKNKNVCSLDFVRILDIMDQMEAQKLQKNLQDYQIARRKLIYETTNLHSINEIFGYPENQK